MPTYVTFGQIRAALPPDYTAQLLDDLGTGLPDASAWAEISARVTDEIDGKIGQRYSLPVTDVTALKLLGQFAFVFAAELCYQRKGFFGESNPWAKRAEAIRGDPSHPLLKGELDRIAAGEMPLTAAASPAKHSASAITEPAKTTSAAGSNLC